jgi:hypothetical protein
VKGCTIIQHVLRNGLTMRMDSPFRKANKRGMYKTNYSTQGLGLGLGMAFTNGLCVPCCACLVHKRSQTISAQTLCSQTCTNDLFTLVHERYERTQPICDSMDTNVHKPCSYTCTHVLCTNVHNRHVHKRLQPYKRYVHNRYVHNVMLANCTHDMFTI